MPTCCYKFEIPNPARPIPNAAELSPSGELVPFEPAPFDAAQLAGRSIDDFVANVGTYGMGGPGFVALQLGQQWLVIALWGAAAWMTSQGRLIEDLFHEDAGRPPPWIDPETGDNLLRERLIGHTIESIAIDRRALRIGLSGGYDLTIAEDPATRPVFAGNKEPRAFAPDDDLRRAIFLSPTIELWV
jgi:hypothetical protein